MDFIKKYRIYILYSFLLVCIGIYYITKSPIITNVFSIVIIMFMTRNKLKEE